MHYDVLSAVEFRKSWHTIEIRPDVNITKVVFTAPGCDGSGFALRR